MGQLIFEGGVDPTVRRKAAEIIRDAGADFRDADEVIAALWEWTQREITYMFDPWDAELLVGAPLMIDDSESGDPATFAIGDCDDFVITASALARAAGFPTLLKGISGQPESDGNLDHVYALIGNPEANRWVPFDAIQQGMWPGWEPPRFVNWMIFDPSEGKLVDEGQGTKLEDGAVQQRPGMYADDELTVGAAGIGRSGMGWTLHPDVIEKRKPYGDMDGQGRFPSPPIDWVAERDRFAPAPVDADGVVMLDPATGEPWWACAAHGRNEIVGLARSIYQEWYETTAPFNPNGLLALLCQQTDDQVAKVMTDRQADVENQVVRQDLAQPRLADKVRAAYRQLELWQTQNDQAIRDAGEIIQKLLPWIDYWAEHLERLGIYIEGRVEFIEDMNEYAGYVSTVLYQLGRFTAGITTIIAVVVDVGRILWMMDQMRGLANGNRVAVAVNMGKAIENTAKLIEQAALVIKIGNERWIMLETAKEAARAAFTMPPEIAAEMVIALDDELAALDAPEEDGVGVAPLAVAAGVAALLLL